MITTALVAGLCGAVVGLAVAKLYVVKHHNDGRTEAYESGWNDGYDIGMKTYRPKRVKKITKADAPIERKKKDEVTHQLPESSIANASLAIAEYAVIHEMLSHDDNDDDFDDGDDE